MGFLVRIRLSSIFSGAKSSLDCIFGEGRPWRLVVMPIAGFWFAFFWEYLVKGMGIQRVSSLFVF